MIHLSRLSDTDLFGRFNLRIPNARAFSGYYSCIDVIRPFLSTDRWAESVTGFYINVAGNFDSVRLSYFTASPDLPEPAINDFAGKSGLDLKVADQPHRREISRGYGNEEIRFRRFLSTYAPIGLEIMRADLLHARCLFATFRWQVMRARQPYRPHFLRTFESQSDFYNSLATQQQDQFWRDLAHWPNPPQVDWAHLFVNMVLGCDWMKGWKQFLSPQPPLTIQETNKRVKSLHFQIPNQWQP